MVLFTERDKKKEDEKKGKEIFTSVLPFPLFLPFDFLFSSERERKVMKETKKVEKKLSLMDQKVHFFSRTFSQLHPLFLLSIKIIFFFSFSPPSSTLTFTSFPPKKSEEKERKKRKETITIIIKIGIEILSSSLCRERERERSFYPLNSQILFPSYRIWISVDKDRNMMEGDKEKMRKKRERKGEGE